MICKKTLLLSLAFCGLLLPDFARASSSTVYRTSSRLMETGRPYVESPVQARNRQKLVSNANADSKFAVGNGTFLLNGKPFVIKAAEIHYPRIPRAYWENRIEMCKALGMNTLCLYVFWNLHEPQEGKFDFTADKDVAAFCRLAQKHGMYVIVRPGPYVCAEWEMGGLPWWLLKKKDIKLREQDPYFMQRVKIFEEKVAQQLAPLTIAHGGPIIMVQVENEYGSYGVNKPYVRAIRDMLKTDWGKVVLFQCDWSSNFENNGLDDLLWTMNFGTGANIDQQFARLGQLRPQSPKMCSEFWSGWFDKWGAHHETRPAAEMVDGINEMLSKGISFSLYMTHGGTSFGHWAGANSPGFAPDVTSYDYDAPINEYGLPTEKFWILRKVMQKFSPVKLPKVPQPVAKLISIPSFKLTEHAPLINGVDSMGSGLKTFEDMNMGWGSMIYTTTLPRIDHPTVLTVNGLHDYGQIFINGKWMGKIDRVLGENAIALPAMNASQNKLTIVVEGMGRINFGRAIKDYKGITGSVALESKDSLGTLSYAPEHWTSYTIPDTYADAVKAFRVKGSQNLVSNWENSADENRMGYYRGYFNLKKTGDTFLNMEAFGKGLVYVNGHALGRFWHIGPQQTLYLPGCWLKKGRNEVIVLDITGPQGAPVCYAENHPELNKLHLEKSAAHNQPEDQPDLNSKTPVASGQMKPGNGWQTIHFAQPVTGRYLALQIMDNQNGQDVSSIAELYLRDSAGNHLNRDGWTVKYADSEDVFNNHTGEKAFDLQESTYWSTVKGKSFPHLLVIDLGSNQTVTGFDYLPRAEQGAPESIGSYKIFVY